MATSDFMLHLANELVEDRGIVKATALAYVRKLWRLNGKENFNDLNFLRNYGAIDEIINTYAKTTRALFYTTITSVLYLYKDRGYDEDYKHYSKAMDLASEGVRSESNKKSDAQVANWLSWSDVVEVREKLRGKAHSVTKPFTNEQFETVTQYVLLSMLTLIPPRRNLDWLRMYAVRVWTPRMATDRNYFDMSTSRFIFNVYKTARKYGQQIVGVPPDLRDVLMWYLETLHPNFRPKQAKGKQTPLLINRHGEPFKSSTYITRVLNKAFAGNVSTTLLRTVYLTDKYKGHVDEMAEDAEAMAHSTAVQRSHYIKDDA